MEKIVKEKVWKLMGIDIAKGATSAEAMVQAGLDFEVVKKGNTHNLPSGTRKESDSSFFTFRTDTEAILGDRLGSDYTVLQNVDAFSFFDSIVGGRGGIRYETAGALGYGETIFITAKLPEHIKVGRDDLIEQYLFLTSTHNGSGCITIAFTPVRIWCKNTLNAALANCSNGIKIRHTASAHDKLKSAHKMLGISDQLSHELEAIFNRWTRVRITDPQVKRLIQMAMIPKRETYDRLKTGKDEDLSSRYKNMVSSVFDYAMTHETQQHRTTKGTLFGAYNSVAGYFQNVRDFTDQETKFKSIMQGTGFDRTKAAFDLCLDFAKRGESALQLN